MKNNLKKIYQDLAGGKLSQKEALEKIRILKLSQQEGIAGTLLVTPTWEQQTITVQPGQDQFEYTQRHVVLCELPHVNAKMVESSIANCHCLSLQTKIQKNIAECFNEVAETCFELIKKILKDKPHGQVLVQIVLANKQEETLFAGLSGLLKTAALENPMIRGQIILAMPDIKGEVLVIHLQMDKTRDQDKIIKYEHNVRYVLRLQEVHPNPDSPKIAFKDNGVYLITGGLGGLGVLFAKEIIKQTHKAQIILVGRSALTSDKKKMLEELSIRNGSVQYRQLDIADFDQVNQLMDATKKEYNKLHGIIHCAGIHLDNFILTKSAKEFRQVLKPKVNGTFNLDKASQDMDLDFIAMFSSVASWLGNTGQADYATANSFMDHFAVYRNSLVALKRRKGKTLSINWPLWAEGGMSMDQTTQKMLKEITGLHTLQTSSGMLNFYRSLELTQDQIMVMDGDIAHIRRGLFENQPNPPMVQPVMKTSTAAIDSTNFFEKTQDFLCKQLAAQLKIVSHQLNPQEPLEKYGIDSIMAMNLTNQLEKTFGSLPKTLFFEFQTIHELSGYFLKSYPEALTALFIKNENNHIRLQPIDNSSKTIPTIQTHQISGGRFINQQSENLSTKINTTITNDPIAIIGLSGRYPEAKNIQEYWQNLRDGKDCITEVPIERWDWHEYYTEDRNKKGYHYSKWGGFISGVDEFDPRFFNISPREAAFIDPQERLFLQHAWMAVEDAGYTRAGLQLPQENDLAGQVGVYVGVMYGEYQLFGAQANANGKRIGLINSYSSIANRVSYVLNLHGPSMTLDTMCSSSLTAIHLACQDLKLGRTNMAIAGGVNVSIHPNKYLFLSEGQFISTDGHCQSFGEGGDGYIPGEGVGAVLLKRLSEAIRDGNHIYGIIKGSSLNHGGKTNGYSVPNPQAQAGVISRAIAESGINARHISYIEAHGTGTKLGDPIEIAALSKAFNQFTEDTQFCLVGSAKSNIGHCESAAGIAGLTKILLQIKHKQIVPSLHSNMLNPYIDFPKTPFIVNQKLKAWDKPKVNGQLLPRIAGLSSFGAGGSNAHIILQEYIPQETKIPVALTGTNNDVIIALSARTADQLKEKVRDLLDFIHIAEQDRQSEGSSDTVDLLSMAYTLHVGREAMEERLGFIVNTISQLSNKLQDFLIDKQDIEDIYQGQVKRNKETLSLFANDADLQQTIENWIDNKKLAKLLELWVKGWDLDWNKIYDDIKPQRISLPAYPFAKERYWIDITEGETVTETGPSNAVIHPLLHSNTSDLSQQRYTSVFNGTESFFEKNQKNGQKILKNEVYEEMARSAVENALPDELGSTIVIALHNVILGQPFVFAENKKVSIALLAKNSEQIDFEIYSHQDEEEVIHCQGKAILNRQSLPFNPDKHQLTRQNGHASQPLAPKQIHIGFKTPVNILNDLTELQAFEQSATKTTGGISLVTPGERVSETNNNSLNKPSITFSNSTFDASLAEIKSDISPLVSLFDNGNGIFSILIKATDRNNTLSENLIDQLLQTIDTLQRNDTVKVLIIKGSRNSFLCGGRSMLNVAIEKKLFQIIASFPYPVIAAMQGNATGAGFLMGALCDMMICSEEGTYSYADENFYPSENEYILLRERFGDNLLRDFLNNAKGLRGKQLMDKGWTCPVIPQDQVESYSRSLASSLARKSQESLCLLKQHLAGNIVTLANALNTVDPLTKDSLPNNVKQGILEDHGKINDLSAWLALKDEKLKPFGEKPVSVELASKVIAATRHPEEILVVKMEDREAKNMFSDALVDGIIEVFNHIKNTSVYKVVILTGFDNYFASGGTKETLLEIQKGKIKFTDTKIFHLAMECSIPVIAAMKGHGIGAGWSLGMFADFIIFSEESKYISPYMNYGFTPGALATLIFPEKLGYDLAREILLTAQEYSGSDLKSRGITMQVLPREKVLPGAMDLARQIAKGSRKNIITLKHQFTHHILKRVEAYYKLELEMHEKTFVGKSETLQMIQNNFGDGHGSIEKNPIENSTHSGPVGSLSGADNLFEVKTSIGKWLAQELHLKEDEIDENTQFVDLGLDSITGVTWVRKINEKYKTSLEATKIYSFPTLVQFSRLVKEEAEKLGTLSDKTAEAVIITSVPPTTVPMVSPNNLDFGFTEKLTSLRRKQASRMAFGSSFLNHSQPIAIIGMAGQFPGARNIDEFWANIASGKSCITPVPETRWDLNTYFSEGSPLPGKTNCKWLGTLAEYDLFDPLFFNISPTEAISMDPQQRVLLQACWHSIESAGYNPKALSGSRCGVYMGCAGGDYHLLSRELQLSAQGFTGGATSILAARISYLLNLQGPCLSIDTACSSSLVAIATACDSLVAGNSDIALAGGVYVMVGPDMHIKSSQSGMLSRDGRCYTFDQRANGFVPGEGVGVIMLKRLSDAESDNDLIYGVIQGWGVNQDGKTNGITAPNEESQTRLEQEVYDRFQIDPNSIQLIEAHGTGTKLGDPIEVAALKKAFQKYTQKKDYCALGSVKSNIGHCLTAAGVSSTIKVLLALKNRQLPPSANFESLNEHINLQDSPFYVNDKLQEWKISDADRRQAAISAFGFGGTNAHLVVAEYLPSKIVKPPVSVIMQQGKLIIPLSARTEDQLKQKVNDLLGYIRTVGPSVDLVEIAYTLQVGREEMGERLCFMVVSLEQLAEKLQEYLNGAKDIQDLYMGQVKRNKEGLSLINRDDDLKKTIIDTWINQNKLSNLIDLWVKGMELDWTRLYGEVKPQRINLPLYPFAKERYWFNETESEQDGKTIAKFAVLHPLLHRNVSDLNQQRYSSVFSGEESFIKDNQINGNKVLSAFTCIEMARAAVMQATSTSEKSTVLALSNMVWDRPVFIKADKEVSIALTADDNEGIFFEIFSPETANEKVYCQGEAFFSNEDEMDSLDIAQLKAMTGNIEIDSASLNKAFSKMNLDYESAFHGLSAIYKGSDKLFAMINISAASAKTAFYLHPGIMESTFQACMALVTDIDKLQLQPLQPVALNAITIFSGSTDAMYIWVRYSGENQSQHTFSLDVDLCDQEGNVCVKMRGLELSYYNDSFVRSPDNAVQPDDAWDKISYICTWEPQTGLIQKKPEKHKSVLIICSAPAYNFEATIQEYYKKQHHCKVTTVRMSNKTKQLSEMEWTCDINNSESLHQCMQKTDAIDAFYFLAMNEQTSEDNSYEKLIENQECNEIQMLRIIKYLKQSNKVGEKIDTYILTLDNYSLNQSPGTCFGAGVTGFGYSLAQGKYQFLVRNLDLSSEDVKNHQNHKDIFETIYNQHSSGRGELFKLQSGRRYRQLFLKLKWNETNTQAIRQNGVYVIAGGSGTVGKIITRNLIQKYNARIIWLGRSAKDSEKVHKALELYKEFSGNVFYFQADLKQQQSVQHALELIKKQFSEIHGALFAGMVFDFENSIDETTEAEFRSILEVKTQGSWIFYNALKNEPLDFMCYFSSGQAYSFSGASKLSAYATAITFSDRLVQSFNKQSSFPVGIINWGFWKSSVDVIAEGTDRVSTDHLDALDDLEGFGCFEKFVHELKIGSMNQVLCMKVPIQLESLINCKQDEYTAFTQEQGSCSSLEIEIPREKIDKLKRAHEQNQLEKWLVKLLFCQFNIMIQSSGREVPETIVELQKQCMIKGKYIKWFQESLNMLAAKDYMLLKDGHISGWQKVDTKTILREWQLQKEQYCQDVEFKSLVILLDDCLQKLPEILQGDQLATDIIFPNSSMEKVEGIYKNNTTSDTFNEIVANAVVAYLRQQLASVPQARLRILEIGAGTGGTSAIVFPKLRSFQKSIDKYCYTDLSKAFFFHAEKNYVPENPYIQCQRLDIEKPIKDQGFEIGSYDLIIATNVLHATKNIRNTLRNAKAALRKNGFIILNEMSDKSLTTHLTFGLLDGWWLFEDGDLRIPNCPGLYASSWQQVFEEEGFTSVKFPVQDAHILGQQIIIAQSDGIIRQKEVIRFEPKIIPPLHSAIPVTMQKKNTINKTQSIAKPNQNVKEYIKESILECMSGTLRMSPDKIDPEIAFSDYGIDSILGVNFINQVNSQLSIALNTAVIFEYSSLDKLSEHVFTVCHDQIEKQVNPPQVSSSIENKTLSVDEQRENSAPRASVHSSRRPVSRNFLSRIEPYQGTENRNTEIAVIGMSGMFPKANDLDSFWNNIIKGVDGVDELPDHYLDQATCYSTEKQAGKTRCKWGGIVAERDCFDPLFFNLSPWEAESMNPHQRLVLQEGWKAIENAGYNPKSLSGSQTGVFIGTEPTGYYGETFTGYSDAIIPSRLSYILNLKGPAIALNTGCSSSGVALHLACESLRNKETDMALAGGVNACMDQSVQIRLDEIDMLSPKGRCNTFDAGGSGTIISEGIGIVVLKRLEDAIASNDHIYGVICGSGTNQDGASNGITAPNGAAQEELIVNVYNKYGINPENITYIEAHGTGTKLGDPIEANALVRAFKKFTAKRGYCSVGSAKSHIGHTGAAAAVTGLIKVLLSLKHKQIPQLLHFTTMNPLIEFTDSPFYITTQVSDWKATGDAPRMAALNSFGHSGTNAHLVVKEYIAPINATIRSIPNESVIIPLSAKNTEQLRQKACDLLEFIRVSKDNVGSASNVIDLVAMAYTFQLGRDAMEERLGFVVNSVDQLAENLESYINGNQKIEAFYQGHAKRNKEALSLSGVDSDLQDTVAKWITDKKHANLLELWVKGIELDWNNFYDTHKPRRIGLPSYPFAKEKYWYVKVDPGKVQGSKLKTDNPHTYIQNMDSIEDILDKIDSDSIEKDQALSLLKSLV